MLYKCGVCERTITRKAGDLLTQLSAGGFRTVPVCAACRKSRRLLFIPETLAFELGKGRLETIAEYNKEAREDTKGFLYIMPTDEYADEYGSAESIGPDNETEDWLNAYYRDYEECPSEDNLAAHGLVKIPAVLQRFDPDCGYYHA